ncbi:hypothetical protein EUTSA_v10012203mg [Eutrema salsugineum]|uniref:Uncharacterized protein n=1 Tax=Eutrema salsugineum TaxID=72664 RepID=V4KJW8_EUTSA|nr:hypothetical protein EUTSA_v10012203mg [Eutrema salsugineum]
MVIVPLLNSAIKLVASMAAKPVASVTVLLFYGGLLPRNLQLERLAGHDFTLDGNDYLVQFIVSFLRCLC